MASTSSLIPSSSSTPSIPQTSTYDVFLSFRGEDTRYNFTDHLYKALLRRGIRAFRDDQLSRGEAIAPELLKAIEESRSSVIVFSENYARSRWCLDELVKIMECQKDLGHSVFPIFYHVDPSHVRNQTGSFGDAFAGYEEHWKDKVGRWRTALTEAANLSGWHLVDGMYESNQIEEITGNIFCWLNFERFDVGPNLVGIDSRVNKMIWRLHLKSSDVRIVGIYGVGGIGKTTIAKVIYNKLSCEFEYMTFLENIKESSTTTQGLTHLQNLLLGDILKGEQSQNINSVDQGASMIKRILSSKRVFIVLDDVDDRNHLEALLRCREWLGKGSRVIITTRNKHLLTVQKVDDLYEVEGLNSEEACELFSLHAFKQNHPESEFVNLLCRVVDYCQGLPLALKVLGCLFFEKTISEWEKELDKLARGPEPEIHNVLRRSYDGLNCEEKNIFLDVACFFKGRHKDDVSRILNGCYFDVEGGIRSLNNFCLITLAYNQMRMHDLIQRMGWEIVCEKFHKEPNQWSRLWDPHDIEGALTNYEGIQGVQTISLDLSKLQSVPFNSNAFGKMTRLRLLKVHSGVHFHPCIQHHQDVVMKNASKIQLCRRGFEFSNELRYLYWDGYPLKILPSNFMGENLVELRLKCSNMKRLWQGNKCLERLKVIDLSHSKKLIQMPKFSSMPNLERLILRGCVSLINIHRSVGDLKKLITLDLGGCDKLKCLTSTSGNSESSWDLNLCGCSNFEKFSRIQGNMRSLQFLHLDGTAIRELPSGIDLESLWYFGLSNCFKFEKFPENGANMKSLEGLYLTSTAIKELPTGIVNWESLKDLRLSGCSNFEKFPEIQRNMRSLKRLYLNGTAIRELPSSIGYLENVEVLNLSNCSKFEKFPEKGGDMKSLKSLCLNNTAIKGLPDSMGNLKSLEFLDLSDCLKFEKFPEKGGNMKSLKYLNLKNTAITDLPDGMGDLESLEFLYLFDCLKFEKFPEKGGNMKSLKYLNLKNTAITDLPDSIGDLESLVSLDLSYCSRFEKFPEKGGNMKNLKELCLRNTAIKDLPDSIGDLESLTSLDLSCCSKFDKLSEKVGNIKSLTGLYLSNTAIKDLPDSMGNLESLSILDLSDCSKFVKFPEMKRSMKGLFKLNLRRTPIEELPSIDNLSKLWELNVAECKSLRNLLDNISRLKLTILNISGCSDLWQGLISNHCKMAGQILELPSSLMEIDAHDCRSKEDLSSLLWLCHLNWLKSQTEELKCWELSAVVPAGNGIPEWIRYENLGNEVTTELPTNWYEDPHFLGFVVSCVYQPIATSDDHNYHFSCDLNLHGNGLEFLSSCFFECRCKCHGINNLTDQVWVWWCPKIAAWKEHYYKATHINALFENSCSDFAMPNIKKCGINLIFVGDQHNDKPMLLDNHWNYGNNGSSSNWRH